MPEFERSSHRVSPVRPRTVAGRCVATMGRIAGWRPTHANACDDQTGSATGRAGCGGDVGPRPGRRATQRHLLGAGRVVQHDPDRVRQDHRHQGQHVAQGLGRGAGATDRREGQPEDRRLVRRHRRPAPAGGRAGPDARIQVACAAAAARLGAAAGAQSSYRTVGIYSGPLGFGYNTELLAKKKLRGAQELGRPAEARRTRARSRWPTRRPAAPPTR